MVPLAVIVVAFFLPVARDCNAIRSPLEFATDDPLSFLWIGTPYIVCALLLVVGSVAAVSRRAPSGARVVACLAAALVLAVSLAVSGVIATLPGTDSGARLAGAGAFVAGGVATWLLVRAARRRAWSRFWMILGGHAIACLPIAVANALIGEAYGKYVFLSGYALLAIVQIAALAARPDTIWSRRSISGRGPSCTRRTRGRPR